MSLVSALLGATVGGAVTAWTSATTTSTQLSLQNSQFNEERQKEAREKRVDAYVQLHDAVSNLEMQILALNYCLDQRARKIVIDCTPDSQKLYNNGLAAASSYVRFRVYASDEALDAAEPLSRRVLKVEDIGFAILAENGSNSLREPSVDEFTGPLSRFESVMCKDLSPRPRARC